MNTVLKYPGSKWSLASWIIGNFPPEYEKMTYLEPYFGSGAVFFNKKRSVVETINDIDGNVVNLFKVIRENADQLAWLVENTPWSRQEYKQSYELTGDNLEDARRFLVRMWMAIGAKTSDITGWRNNIKGINGNVVHWNTKLPVRIIDTKARLLHSNSCAVQIENQDALKLIERYNRENVLIYLDPPYKLSTRSKRIYKHEMKDSDHVKLLETIRDNKAKIILSGYDNELYDEYLPGWMKQKTNCTAEGGRPSVETIWMNYKPPKEQLILIE